MYVPEHFAENDLNQLHDAIERYSFATLISQSNGEIEASHLPLLLDRGAGPSGTLLGHMAKANLQWRRAAGQQVLVIFSGPHAYISPQWYQATEVVPTWNYVAIHTYGRLELIEDATAAKELLDKMVAIFESGQPRPWQINEPAEFVERLLRQIVAFRIPIDRLEGKWKLNQNRPAEQRQRVIDVLSLQPDDDSRDIAALMRGRA
ncbi:MAG TPA: FMN-binding negative transcriptional regulator [Pirellulaceae bacterium]|jgi:transcriptional regulator